MPKLTFHWNSVSKLILFAEVHRLVPKLFRTEVTRAEHRLPRFLLNIIEIEVFFSTLTQKWTFDGTQLHAVVINPKRLAVSVETYIYPDLKKVALL